MQTLFLLSDAQGNIFPTQATSISRAIDNLTLKSLELTPDDEIQHLLTIGDPFKIIRYQWQKAIKNVQGIPLNLVTSPLPFKHIIPGL